MEKKKALFVNVLAHTTEDLRRGKYSYTALDPETEATVRAEMESWFIRNYSYYRNEYDDYDDVSTGSDVRDVPISEMISASSGWYSTDDVRGDILVAVGHFAGVTLLTENKSASTWSQSHSIEYALLYTDGTVIGKPESSYCFTGESSSKESENSYSLKKKEA